MTKNECLGQSSFCVSSSLIDSLNQGAIIIDRTGCVVSVNKWFKDILGYEKQEIIGLSHQEMFEKLFFDTGIEYSEFSRNFLRVVNLNKTLKFIRTLTDKHGCSFTVESSLQPLTDDQGNIKGLLCFMKEIDDSILYNIAKSINSSLAIKDVLKTTNKEIVEQLNLSSNAIFLFDQNKDILELVVCDGWKDEEMAKVKLRLGEGVPGLIAQERKSIYVENLHTNDGIVEVARQKHFNKSSIGYPMIFNDTLLGVITFDARTMRLFSERELEIFEHIADFVAMVIYNAQTYEKVLLMANTDGLTGLANHRYFQEVMQSEVEIASATKRNLSLLLLDVDQFKIYNNTYGYIAGDKLLKEISAVLQAVVGGGGEIARFGGDEFAILLPNTTIEQATIIAEDIRKQITETDFSITGNLHEVDVSVSVGVANFPSHAKTKEEMIACSSHALYQAKQRNRNKVVIYFSLLDDLLKSLHQDERELLTTIKTLMRVINAKDNYTVGHSERVTEYALLIGNELKLSDSEMKILRYGAYLHDIGKIEISREILNKPGKLTEEEFAQIKKHPENGVDLLKPIHSLGNIISIVKYHHERYDGTGYPENLKGEEIPFLARIICVADSFDAIISKRPYRTAQSISYAIEELEKCAGTQFDPIIVNVFVKTLKEQYYEFSRSVM